MIPSILLFILAGFCEIFGCYLIWIWARDGKSIWFALFGVLVLTLYGFVSTLQAAPFGRTYAAYGGVFIILSLLWAVIFDSFKPDLYDYLGLIFVLIGVSLIFFTPR